MENYDNMEWDEDQENSYSGKYPIEDLEYVRDYLIDNFVEAPSKYKIDFELKLKCGVINDQIIDYFKNEKIPENLLEESTIKIHIDDQNPFKRFVLDIDPEDQVQPSTSSQVSQISQARQSPSLGSTSQPSSIEIEQSSQISSLSSKFSATFSQSSHSSLSFGDESSIKYLNTHLKLQHGCEGILCTKDLQIKDRLDTLDLVNTVYKCDFCGKTVSYYYHTG